MAHIEKPFPKGLEVVDFSSLPGSDKVNGEEQFCNYLKWEHELATPWLKSQGYEIVKPWWSTEYDSFGPLSRGCIVKKDGKEIGVISI